MAKKKAKHPIIKMSQTSADWIKECLFCFETFVTKQKAPVVKSVTINNALAAKNNIANAGLALGPK
jgi:hypothetical protein